MLALCIFMRPSKVACLLIHIDTRFDTLFGRWFASMGYQKEGMPAI